MSARSPEAVARRYRIERYLTEGGMGAIYLGKKLGSGGFEKEVVLKQLLPEYTARPEFRDLFFREARISATLDHANIVHTFDLVESDQSLFIVMEYVRGADLRTVVRRARQRRRELSPAAAVHIALGILTGLSYAHTRRDAAGTSLDIIHRDVSPSNIICSVQGEAKLSDFGIARASTHSSVFYRVRGKVGYMSPEQARNLPIDHRCDLFSLGVCLYESLSGERLFVGDLTTPAEAIYGHAIMPVSQRRPGIPPALDAVLARALAPELGDRYASAAEFADALRTVAHHSGLAFSAPDLAAHLQDILGEDPTRWLRDEPVPGIPTDTQKVPAASVGLVGKEAASIGIVRGTRDDAPALGMLSPKTVSGGKDFDLDSMLNDEAPRGPGAKSTVADAEVTTTWEGRRDPRPGEPGPAPAAPTTGTTTPRTRIAPPPQIPGETLRERLAPRPPQNRRPSTPGRAAQTPPPVWTRDSGPIATSSEAPSPPAPPAPPPPRLTHPAPLPAPPPPAPPTPTAPAGELPFRKSGARTLRGPSIATPATPQVSAPRPAPGAGAAGPPGGPPPSPGVFGTGLRPAPSAGASAPPPPPPMPPAPVAGMPREEQTSEFEEPTRGQLPPGFAASVGRTPSPLALGPPDPEPNVGQGRPAGGGFGFVHPQPYPPAAPSPLRPDANNRAPNPPIPDLPPTTDFTVDLSGSAGSTRSRKPRSGPPWWLAIGGVLVALGLGAGAADRVTAVDLARLLQGVAELEHEGAERRVADARRAAAPAAEVSAPAAPAGDPTVGGEPPTAVPATAEAATASDDPASIPRGGTSGKHAGSGAKKKRHERH